MTLNNPTFLNEGEYNTLEQFWIEQIQNSNEEGHDYIPEENSFRASMLPYCGRKNILRKNPDWIDLEIIQEKPKDILPHAPDTQNAKIPTRCPLTLS